MRGIFLLTGISVLFCALTPASGTTWYIAPRPLGSDTNPGTEQQPFATIQKGIDSASDADTVIVAQGTYVENIRFKGKNITLTSTDPLDPAIVEKTVIDGNRSGAVVTFSGTEDETCLLSGFTIMDGSAEYGGGICGGTADHPTRATIENNSIARSTGHYGGGAAYCDGTIQNNTIIANTANSNGGGLYDCDATVQHNRVTWNSATCGGGLYGCDGLIRENGFLYNSALDGGGLAHCEGAIHNNTIGWGSADYAGGGLYNCSGNIQDNSIGWNAALDGGGLSHCHGTIQNNAIHGNNAEYGGGMYTCNGTIQNNVIGWAPPLGQDGVSSEHIYGNKAVHGGGLAYCSGVIRNNTISWNSASLGGGLSECDSAIKNNVISANSADRNGGGLYHCDGPIENNLIIANSADENGDGGGCYRCDGMIWNNMIAGNQARLGAGLAFCRGSVQNNTIIGNSAFRGGGLHCCRGTIQNSIIWGNTVPAGPQLWESSVPAFCCLQDWSGGGEGNISLDPQFVDPDGPDDDPRTYEDNDYRLLPTSPCIDAGYNDPALPDTDITGMHRIMFGGKSLTVDMGAYEYYINEIEASDGGIITLTWSSLSGKTYSILYSTDMITWQLAADNIPSLGDTTPSAWLDPTAPLLSPDIRTRFYRILENE